MRRLFRIALLIPLISATGCSRDERSSDISLERSASGGGYSRIQTPPAEPGSDESVQAKAPASGEAQTGATPGQQPPSNPAAIDSAAPRMIIRTGEATLQVDKLEPAIARVEQLAQRMGGYVASTSVQTGSEDSRQATLELKLPAQRWDQAISGLRPLGKLEALSTSTEDVGEEYVDVTARMDNARRLEQRLVDLLANRTGKLEDVLAVERELARVREEIERYEGRLRFLRSRVSLSTLKVTLHEPLSVIGGRPGGNPIVAAFRQAWDNFVGFLAGFIASLGVLVPLGLILAAIVWIFRRVMRSRQPRMPGGPWTRPGGPVPGPQAPPPAGRPADMDGSGAPSPGSGPGAPPV